MFEMGGIVPAAEAQVVQDAIVQARRGGATLDTLFAAHQIAAKYDMTACLAELRYHIHRQIPDPRGRGREIAFSVFLGVVSGAICNAIL